MSPRSRSFSASGSLGQQVGRVVWSHRLEHVSRALALKGRQDLDLLLFGQFFQDVGQPLVVERRGDLGSSLFGQVVHHTGEVGRAQLVESREQVRRTLGVLLE